MRARDHLRKALMLLDRGFADRGESSLTTAITAAEQEPDVATLVTALCCLGDLYAQQNRPAEARTALTACLAVEVPPALDDVCATPRAQAHSLLTTL